VLLPRQRSKLARGAKDKEHAMSQTFNTAIAVIGIDIGKHSFHIVGLDQRGAIVLRQRWSRGQVEARFANMPPCLIGMEACVGAHHLSRKLKMLGHDARLMPAKYVRPYSRGQKNDFRDAEAIAEAVQRPTMKFVATKTADQLDLQLCIACASAWLGSCTDREQAYSLFSRKLLHGLDHARARRSTIASSVGAGRVCGPIFSTR
jgi:transposase